MQKWDLSLDERVALLQQWILPLLVFPARVVYPTEQVISSLRTVYHIALRLNSWSLTVDILSLPKVEGGCCLPTPRSFLLWQHASSYVHFLQHPEAFSSVVSNHFTRWADKVGRQDWAGPVNAFPALFSNGFECRLANHALFGWLCQGVVSDPTATYGTYT